MEKKELKWSRRDFIGTLTAAGALMLAYGNGRGMAQSSASRMLDVAPNGPLLKVGLIGCGGRGTGAAMNFLAAGPNLEIAALADTFQDRLNNARATVEERMGKKIPDGHCFVGFDGFKKVMDTDVEMVILATPPHFRPEHFAAAVNAGKHVFMEKPVAVDPVGIRMIMETADKATTLGLKVVTGTQRRHQHDYVETYKRIADGAIGEIVAARCYWNQGQLWYRERQEDWSDMEVMLRDWVNWCWLSGDHIVEQHVHNIDVINWFTGMHPVKAVGFGARMRRVTGDQYDFFNIDFEMANGMHVHSMCRQIHGCANNVSEYIVGTKGSTNCRDTIYKEDGNIAWEYDSSIKEITGDTPYVQEHIDLITAIRTNQPINEAKNTAISTMTAIMGRQSAYTGREMAWDEMMASDMRLGPTEYAMGDVDLEAVIPVPGQDRPQGS
ncbi:Gfo/Idh/MocA family oxidoreductase [bacterium]|nr:Gfo/Idh/MocA family oxidoreductase [bacterium]RQV94395.1 MAG: gfo/Idh/MocA family oxidoreductase [bacterium]